MMHAHNIEVLREEAQRLLKMEVILLNQMLNEPWLIVDSQKGEKQTFDRQTLPQYIQVLEGEQAKLTDLEMVLAVVGTMKAGKS
ncbi:MAG: hypothetical protein IPI79_06940 [Moraxellaceae bacterium]|nr:hypothetical protein [Moraxellaceae bacterium]